jgi:hypothetical protein
MKNIFLLALGLLFSVATYAGPIAKAKGKVSTHQEGNVQIVECNWQFWKTCWTLYEGYLELGDGRIWPNATIIEETHCDDPETCEFSAVYVVSVPE